MSLYRTKPSLSEQNMRFLLSILRQMSVRSVLLLIAVALCLNMSGCRKRDPHFVDMPKKGVVNEKVWFHLGPDIIHYGTYQLTCEPRGAKNGCEEGEIIDFDVNLYVDRDDPENSEKQTATITYTPTKVGTYIFTADYQIYSVLDDWHMIRAAYETHIEDPALMVNIDSRSFIIPEGMRTNFSGAKIIDETSNNSDESYQGLTYHWSAEPVNLAPGVWVEVLNETSLTPGFVVRNSDGSFYLDLAAYDNGQSHFTLRGGPPYQFAATLTVMNEDGNTAYDTVILPILGIPENTVAVEFDQTTLYPLYAKPHATISMEYLYSDFLIDEYEGQRCGGDGSDYVRFPYGFYSTINLVQPDGQVVPLVEKTFHADMPEHFAKTKSDLENYAAGTRSLNQTHPVPPPAVVDLDFSSVDQSGTYTLQVTIENKYYPDAYDNCASFGAAHDHLLIPGLNTYYEYGNNRLNYTYEKQFEVSPEPLVEIAEIVINEGDSSPVVTGKEVLLFADLTHGGEQELTYSWSPAVFPGGAAPILINSDQAGMSFTPAATGLYVFRVVVSSPLGQSEKTVSFTVGDPAGFTISAISGNTSEDGTTATFTIKLNSQPDGSVVINVVSSDTTEGTVSPDQLTFTPSNWSSAQTVIVTGGDDARVDGNQDYTIALSIDANTTDTTGYATLDPDGVAVTNHDDDVAGFTISAISGNTIEDGTTATFTAKLNTQPNGNVVINVVSSDTTEGTVSPAQLTFTSANWNANQSVTVTGQNDDAVDGDQHYAVWLTVDGSTTDTTGYADLDPNDVSVINTDNEIPGFTISAISGNTSESRAKATSTIKLNTQPNGDVVINVSSSDTSEGTVSPTQLTFNSTNWNANQTITVTGEDDEIADGDQNYSILLTIDDSTTVTTGYTALDPDDVSVINTDNDSGGFTVSAISDNTTELGATATFTVKLNSQPNGDVVVNLASSDTTEGAVSPAQLTFTSANWNANQIVTVTGLDDELTDGDQDYSILLTVDDDSTTDTTGYTALEPDDVSVINTDNDSGGLTISAISGNTTELGATATFTVKLNSQPDGDVVVNLASSDTTEGTVSPTQLTFTSANWNANQTVTVTGMADELTDGDQGYSILLTIDDSTTDTTGYAASDPDDVSVINNDTTPGFTISAISGNTSEDGATAAFTVSLNSQPNGNVLINVASSDTTEGTVSLAQLTFTSANWNANQTVTVTGLDDDTADGDQSYSIWLSTAQGTADTSGYTDLNTSEVAVINTDNDSGGFTISAISGNTSELGATATFTVKLNAQPDGDVVINVVSSDAGEGVVSVSQLIFDVYTWNTNQTVTITGQDDFIPDGDQEYSILLTIDNSTTDTTGYAALNPDDVAVTNTDNDSLGFTISSISGNTSESGATTTFTARLNTQPDGNVVINVVSSNTDEGTVSPSQLTFTSANWNANQIVTVTGVDDDVIDGNQAYSIALTIDGSTTDTTGYAALNPDDLSVTNLDNDNDSDPVGFTISEISGNTNEIYGSVTFTIRLNTQPDGDVVVHIAVSDATEAMIPHDSVTFTSANWDTDQTVTVVGLPDYVADGDQPYVVELTIDGGTNDTTGYADLNPEDVSVINIDSD